MARRGAEEYEGAVELYQGDSQAVASARVRIIVAACIDGAALWRGTLESVSPPDVTLLSGEYHLLLPENGAEARIVIRRANGDRDGACEFEGIGEPPLLH